MKWEEFKKTKLDYLQDHLNKNKVDLEILPLLMAINETPYFVTSSSCYGRLSLLEIDRTKKDAHFYKKWHRTVSFDEVYQVINTYKGSKRLWFNCEPFILHIFTKDLESANNFLNLCRKSGLKKGGIWIIKDFPFIEVFGTNTFSYPLFDKKLLIPQDFLKYSIDEANIKLESNFKQIKKLLNHIKSE